MKTAFRHSPAFVCRSAAATMLMVALGLGCAAVATADQSAQSQAARVVAAAPSTAAQGHRGAAYRVSSKAPSASESVDTRIQYLHGKFAITAAQEENWNKVAVLMRENANKISALVKSRADNAKTMTAVDDLKAYADISGAHEDGTQKLIPAFKTLYDSMSDAQKKVADEEFRGHGHYLKARRRSAS
jgi:hypothetical protein